MYIDIYIYRTHKHVQVLNKPFGSWHLSLSPEYFWIYQNWPYRSSFFVKFPPFPLGPFFLATKPSCNIRIQQSQHLRAVLHGYTQLHLLHLATWKPHHHQTKIRPFHRFSGLGEAAMSSWTNEELSTLVATIVLANPCLENGEGRMMIRIWKGCFLTNVLIKFIYDMRLWQRNDMSDRSRLVSSCNSHRKDGGKLFVRR